MLKAAALSAESTAAPATKPEAPTKELKPTRTRAGLRAAGNVALASRGARAFAPIRPEVLNDGKTTGHTLSLGFAYGPVPARLGIEFPAVYAIRQIRILLLDGDARIYRYKVECSSDGKTWKLLTDRTKKDYRSWQI